MVPLVIQAQPFGETEIGVFDADFLPAPRGPDARVPAEASAPGWVRVKLSDATTSRVPLAILDGETNS